MAEVELEGAQDLLIKFKTINNQVQGKVTQFALRKASNVLKKAVVGEMMRVDRESSREAIWRNVVVRNKPKRFRKTGELETRLGILGGARSRAANEANPGGDTFYWRFLEFGTERVPAQRNITKTVKRKQGDFMSTFTREMDKAIDRAVKRAKKAARDK